MIGATDELSRRLPTPGWMRPAIGGLLVGIIAVFFPQVLGVGYGTTESALTASFPFVLLVALLVAKIAATVLSLGFGFGGGIFSPALVIGAPTVLLQRKFSQSFRPAMAPTPWLAWGRWRQRFSARRSRQPSLFLSLPGTTR